MAEKASATVQMDENGRVTIPKSTRKALDIDGETAHLDLDILVLKRRGEKGS
ncbi:MAG: AbrB/MazE/SpoVT family DNA-binding domain-containing protein [Euryarchaeota archaeon]|nr:AbrB/MazE/SpoVT family DNA-binding domain-containing protein [Euryarchaeota archaeon]